MCAQPLLCSPIASAILDAMEINDGKVTPDEWNVPKSTIAEGTSIARPVRLKECVDAVRYRRDTAEISPRCRRDAAEALMC